MKAQKNLQEAIHESVKEHFASNNLKFQPNDERHAVHALFGGENGSYSMIVRADKDGLLQAAAIAPLKVPSGCRADVAESVSRANHGLRLGKSELDYDDGSIQFQAATIVESVPSDQTIGRLVACVLGTLDRYMPALASVMYANDTPRDAIARVEAAV